jgi:hypothetical protein
MRGELPLIEGVCGKLRGIGGGPGAVVGSEVSAAAAQGTGRRTPLRGSMGPANGALVCQWRAPKWSSLRETARHQATPGGAALPAATCDMR